MGSKNSKPDQSKNEQQKKVELSPEEMMIQQRLRMLSQTTSTTTTNNTPNPIPNEKINSNENNVQKEKEKVHVTEKQEKTIIKKEEPRVDFMEVDSKPIENQKQLVDFPKENSNEILQESDNKIDRKASSDEAFNLPRTSSDNIKSEKEIDLENVTLEKIFRISLIEENKHKFLFLEEHVASLLSLSEPLVLRISDLDEIIILLMNHQERVYKNINKEKCYHRAYEMIEKRFKSKYDEKYQTIKRLIASYTNIIVSSPENFGLSVSADEIMKELIKFMNETEADELDSFFNDLVKYSEGEPLITKNFFNYIFEIIHNQNISSNPNLFLCEKLKKNMKFLMKLFNEHPIIAEAYCENPKFNPPVMNGKFLQSTSSISLYFSINPLECDIKLLNNQISARSQQEVDSTGKALCNKLNLYLNDLYEFFKVLLKATERSQNLTLNWVCSVINLNLERNKMYVNHYVVSSLGFLNNIIYILMKYLDEKNNFFGNNVLKETAEINNFFSITTNRINFSKFERINSDDVKELVEKEFEPYNNQSYSLNTIIYFMIHCLLNYTLKNFEDEYKKLLQQIQTYASSGMISDPKFKDSISLMKACDCYIRNDIFIKNTMKLYQATIIQFLAFSNKKFSLEFLRDSKINEKTFFEEFYENMSFDDCFELSMLPNCLVKNLAIGLSMIRQFHPDALLNETFLTKIFAIFSIIYSSNPKLLKNPHLRSEVFDIIFYFINIHPQEQQRTPNITNLTKIMQDNFVKNNLINTLMVIFNDAERLGTSNQFYEKFNVRTKILMLVLDNILKKDKTYSSKITEFANNYSETCTRMINLLISDLTFLNDEVLEKLEEIKKYQDLLSDVEKYKGLDQEYKNLEQEKFNNNDRICKSEVKMFNLSMEFMVVICKNCSQNFFNLKLGEKLANLINYSLDVYTGKRGTKLKIKNMKDYEFDPKFILINIIRIYNSFFTYDEFYEFVVCDERSFRITNFEKVLKIHKKGKISQIGFDEIKIFEKMIEKLRATDEEMKSKKISYDDAPDHFLDSITTELMEDPVQLPSSQQVVDRNTIEKHLHSDPTDPFNRSKLTKDMLIPLPELRMEIEEYKKSKQKK